MLEQTNPNANPYDAHLSMLVLAENEEQARTLAAEKAWDEGADTWLGKSKSSIQEVDTTKAQVLL